MTGARRTPGTISYPPGPSFFWDGSVVTLLAGPDQLRVRSRAADELWKVTLPPPGAPEGLRLIPGFVGVFDYSVLRQGLVSPLTGSALQRSQLYDVLPG